MNQSQRPNQFQVQNMRRLFQMLLVMLLLISPDTFVAPDKTVMAASSHVTSYASDPRITTDLANIIEQDPSWLSVANLPTNATDLVWVELDGDGYLELAISSETQEDVIYDNIDGTLSNTAIWTATQKIKTYQVVSGDIDNDGDVDIFFGHDLFINRNGVLDTQYTQRLKLEDDAVIALGDLNNDDWIDVIVGNNDFDNRLDQAFLNLGGTFDETPIWTSTFGRYTEDIQAGDMDNDGDLDIVAGMDIGTGIYWNDNGVLSTTPIMLPSVGSRKGIEKLSLGDLDNDQDLDIGVDGETDFFVYTNLGNQNFESTWHVNSNWFITGVAWGDLDGNGYLDLVGNDAIYFNHAGQLETTPSWRIQNGTNRAIAIADADANGHLDLGIIDENTYRAHVYLNQSPILHPEPVWTSTETSRTNCIAMGDANGDGFLDLAAANNNGLIQVYLSDGTASFSPTDLFYDDGYETRGVAWGDVDGDGDLDLVTGNENAPNQLYENVDGVLRTPPAQISPDADQTTSIALADYDGDQDLDIVVGNEDAETKIYANQGGAFDTLFASAPVWVSRGDDDTFALTWTDIDGDGDPDLTEGNRKRGVRSYINMDGNLTPELWQPADGESVDLSAWGDVNGDHLPDLAIANRGGTVRVYLNQGNGLLNTNADWVSEMTDKAYSIAWGDVDNDNDLDLAVGNTGEPNKLYLNVDGQLQSAPSWTSSDMNRTLGLAWGDMDGDGDLDLAAANEDNFQSGDGLDRVYRNDNGELSQTAVWTSPGEWHSTSVAWADVDQDGDDDLLIGLDDSRDPNALFLSDGTMVQSTPSWTSIDNSSTIDIAWGNLNGDAYPDLAVAHRSGANFVYINQNGTLPVSPTWQTSKEIEDSRVAWGDYDQDGDDDLLVGNDQHIANRVYLNQDGTLVLAPWSFGSVEKHEDTAWVDIDNDDDLDIVATNTENVIVYHNQLNHKTTDQPLTHGNLFTGIEWFIELPDSINALAWGDVDQDHDLDLAIAGNSNVMVYLNDNGFLQTTAYWTSGETNAPVSLDWADMDQDGYMDLAVGNDQLSDRVYLNIGGQLEQIASWASDAAGRTNRTTSIDWTDVNGDQWPDLAVGSEDEDEPVHIYMNHEGMLETIYSWSSTELENETYAIAWGDMDGDGDPDLAIGNNSDPNDSDASPNRIYLNQQGALHNGASWESIDNYDAHCLAWGDVDGDDDLDLAIAFDKGPTKVFYNVGGAIQRDNAWISNEHDESHGIAWGDMDGDGDLDLAVANENTATRVYKNVNGTLQKSAYWSTAEERDDLSVAWGDINGDGGLDLVVGTDSQGVRVFFNIGNTLEITPGWVSEEDDEVNSIAVGDLNGDGWLDVVAGTTNSPNLVYFNQTGTLDNKAGWASHEFDNTKTVILKDMDGDGDLDLVTGNVTTPNKIHFNVNNALETRASWTATTAESTQHIAVGDVDNDGDYDLATGNYNQSNRIYLNPLRHNTTQKDAPVYVHVSSPATTHAADFFSTPQIISSETIPISYTLYAPIQTTASRILAQYSLDGGGTWHTATQAEGGQPLENLAASPTGTDHVFVWHVKADRVIQHDSVIFRIRVIGNDTHSPILWSAQDGKTRPFRIEDSWYIKVVDEENAVVEDAQVYANGELVGTANRAGLIGVDNPVPVGTPLIAFATVHEEKSLRPHHDDWAYRVLLVNHTWGGEEFVVNEVAQPVGRQTLQLRKEGPLILFNVVIAIEWNATDDYLAEIEQAMRHGSNYLYDSSNGQMAFGQVTIHNNAKRDFGELWNSADIRIATSNIVRPYAYIGGILSSDPNHIIHLGRQWDGQSGSQGAWDAPYGYRTIVHEFMHYAVHVYDEYIALEYDSVGNIIGQIPTYCVGAQNRNPHKDHSNASIMDFHYSSSELSAQGVHGSWSAICQETEQFQRLEGSAWDTLNQEYSDTQNPARWDIITPMELGHVAEGPQAFPTGYPDWPFINIMKDTANSPSLKQLTIRKADDSPYIGVHVTLQKTNGQVIEQGFTDENGELVLYGADIGDVIRVAIFKDGLEATIAIQNEEPIILQLTKS
ncbi:MAG: VCBS repeat-containing protein [Chloroflexota bacterium]